MKKWNTTLLSALTLGAFLTCTSIASAQSTNATARTARRMTVQQRVDRMSSELKLNDEQKTKITALFEADAKKRRELRADTSLERKDRREKNRALMQDEKKQMKEILTPDQFEQWQKMSAQGRKRNGAAKKNAAQ